VRKITPIQEQDEDEVAYEDDAALLIAHEIKGEFAKELGNYAYVTQTRNLSARAGGSSTPNSQSRNGISILPDPSIRIQQVKHAKILGGEIHMAGIQGNAGILRLPQSETWMELKKPICANVAITARIRILMRSAMVRTTTPYALHTWPTRTTKAITKSIHRQTP